jgi:hypothetical protein
MESAFLYVELREVAAFVLYRGTLPSPDGIPRLREPPQDPVMWMDPRIGEGPAPGLVTHAP